MDQVHMARRSHHGFCAVSPTRTTFLRFPLAGEETLCLDSLKMGVGWTLLPHLVDREVIAMGGFTAHNPLVRPVQHTTFPQIITSPLPSCPTHPLQSSSSDMQASLLRSYKLSP